MRLDFEVSHSQKFEKYVAEDDVDCNYRASLCVCVWSLLSWPSNIGVLGELKAKIHYTSFPKSAASL